MAHDKSKWRSFDWKQIMIAEKDEALKWKIIKNAVVKKKWFQLI